MGTIESELREKLTENGAGLVGFADIGGISSLADRKFKCGISVAVPLNKTIVSENLDGPTRDYYNEYKRVKELLSELGITAASILARRGFSAIILDPSGDLDLERLTTPLPHKAVATMAGLGWIEKNGVLVTKESDLDDARRRRGELSCCDGPAVSALQRRPKRRPQSPLHHPHGGPCADDRAGLDRSPRTMT
jgi:hypothetical protein